MASDIQYTFSHCADVALLMAETEKALQAQANDNGLTVTPEDTGVFRLTGRGANLVTTITPSELRIAGTLGFPASIAADTIRDRIESETPARIRQCEMQTSSAPATPSALAGQHQPAPNLSSQAPGTGEDVPKIHWRPLDYRNAKRATQDYRYNGDPTPDQGMSFVVDLSSDDYGRFLRVAAMIDVRMHELTSGLNELLGHPSSLKAELAGLQSRVLKLESRLRTAEGRGTSVAEVGAPTGTSDASGSLAEHASLQHEVRKLWLAFGGLALLCGGALIAVFGR